MQTRIDTLINNDYLAALQDAFTQLTQHQDIGPAIQAATQDINFWSFTFNLPAPPTVITGLEIAQALDAGLGIEDNALATLFNVPQHDSNGAFNAVVNANPATIQRLQAFCVFRDIFVDPRFVPLWESLQAPLQALVDHQDIGPALAGAQQALNLDTFIATLPPPPAAITGLHIAQALDAGLRILPANALATLFNVPQHDSNGAFNAVVNADAATTTKLRALRALYPLMTDARVTTILPQLNVLAAHAQIGGAIAAANREINVNAFIGALLVPPAAIDGLAIANALDAGLQTVGNTLRGLNNGNLNGDAAVFTAVSAAHPATTTKLRALRALHPLMTDARVATILPQLNALAAHVQIGGAIAAANREINVNAFIGELPVPPAAIDGAAIAAALDTGLGINTLAPYGADQVFTDVVNADPATTTNLRGQARVQAFLNDPVIRAMPVIGELFRANNEAVTNTLAGYLADAGHAAPDVVAVRAALANPANNTNARMRGVFGVGGPFGVDLPVATPGTLADDQKARAKKLRGQARVQAFLSDPVIRAIPMIEELFTVNNGAVADALADHLKNAGHAAPDVLAVREALANPANNTNALMRDVFGVGGPFGAVNLPVATPETLADGQARANELRGQAAYALIGTLLLPDNSPLKAQLMEPANKNNVIRELGRSSKSIKDLINDAKGATTETSTKDAMRALGLDGTKLENVRKILAHNRAASSEAISNFSYDAYAHANPAKAIKNVGAYLQPPKLKHVRDEVSGFFRSKEEQSRLFDERTSEAKYESKYDRYLKVAKDQIDDVKLSSATDDEKKISLNKVNDTLWKLKYDLDHGKRYLELMKQAIDNPLLLPRAWRDMYQDNFKYFSANREVLETRRRQIEEYSSKAQDLMQGIAQFNANPVAANLSVAISMGKETGRAVVGDHVEVNLNVQPNDPHSKESRIAEVLGGANALLNGRVLRSAESRKEIAGDIECAVIPIDVSSSAGTLIRTATVRKVDNANKSVSLEFHSKPDDMGELNVKRVSGSWFTSIPGMAVMEWAAQNFKMASQVNNTDPVRIYATNMSKDRVEALALYCKHKGCPYSVLPRDLAPKLGEAETKLFEKEWKLIHPEDPSKKEEDRIKLKIDSTPRFTR